MFLFVWSDGAVPTTNMLAFLITANIKPSPNDRLTTKREEFQTYSDIEGFNLALKATFFVNVANILDILLLIFATCATFCDLCDLKCSQHSVHLSLKKINPSQWN